MNEVRVMGTIESEPERWFVNGLALVRCYVRAQLPTLDYFPEILQPDVVVEVLAREKAVTRLWAVRPGERVWAVGRLSFVSPGTATGLKPSSLLVDATEAGCCPALSDSPDHAQLVLTGTVRDRAAEQLPVDKLRTYFLLANPLVLPCPFPNPDGQAIFTVLGLALRERLGGFELGERVTLRGHLVTLNTAVDRDGSTHFHFLATDLLAEQDQLDESLVLLPGSSAVSSLASNLVQ